MSPKKQTQKLETSTAKVTAKANVSPARDPATMSAPFRALSPEQNGHVMDSFLECLLRDLPGGASAYPENLARHQQAFATKDARLSFQRLIETVQACGGRAEPHSMALAIAEVHAIEPRDGVEAMLAVQMVAVHSLAMRYLAAQESALHGRANMAGRLLSLFATQVETLKRYRSSGKQSIAVRHVHVHRGRRKSTWGLSDGGRGEVEIKKIVNEPHAP